MSRDEESIKRPSPIARESEFKIDELFFSTTDKRGVITSGNYVFARVAGYTFEEVLGKPHNVIRHPDMPRCVFELLWDYIGAGKSIIAYVKNMAKDGSYYWVVAYVVPLEDGYLSVRFKPSSPLLGVVEGLYRKLVKIEEEHGSRGDARKAGMKASRAALEQALGSLGFPDYTAFMHSALIEELKSRDILLAESLAMAAPDTNRDCLQRAFAQLDRLQSMQAGFGEKSKFVHEMSSDMQRYAMNANVQAARLGENGRTLGVLAGFLGNGATHLSQNVGALNTTISSLMPKVRGLMFDIAGAKLLNEMRENFLTEQAKATSGAGSADYENPMLVSLYPAQATKVRIDTLAQMFQTTFYRTKQLLSEVSDGLRTLDNSAYMLSKTAKELSFAHVAGRVEVSQLSAASSFPVILEQIKESIERTQQELTSLSSECMQAGRTLTETVHEFSKMNPETSAAWAAA